MSRAPRRKGSGSIYKDAKGRWIVQRDLGVVNGRRKYRRWIFHSLSEAQRHLRTIQDGAVLPGKPPTVAAYLATALEHAASRLRPRTRRSYQQTVDLHIVPFIGHHRITDLTPTLVDHYLRTLRLQKRQTATVKYARIVLRALLKDALKAGWLTTNPAGLSTPVKHRKREIQPLTPAQATSVLATVAGHWVAPMILLMLGVGLRLGEALGLQWADVDLDAGTIEIKRTLQRVHVAGGKRKTQLQVAETKTEKSRRLLPLPSVVTDALKAVHAEYAILRSPWVFCTLNGTPIEPRNVNRAWYPLRTIAGVPTVRLHDLRHSSATFALLLGVSPRAVADMLGHAEIRTTMDTYTHVLPQIKDDVANQIDVLLRSFSPKIQ